MFPFFLRSPHPPTTRLVETLLSLGATPNPSASDARIREAERTLSCSYPEGVRQFYRRCNGMEDTTARWMWDFFSLERSIESTTDRRKRSHLLIGDGQPLPFSDLVCFCDVLIDAPTYLFCANTDDPRYGHFYADSCNEGWLVAKSYEEFVRVFVKEHDEILLGLT